MLRMITKELRSINSVENSWGMYCLDRPAMGVVQFMEHRDHRFLHAIAQTEIAAQPPAADGIAARFQERAQRPRRDVGSHEARQHQHGMAVALRRQAKQRQGAEEGAEFVERRALPAGSGSWMVGTAAARLTEVSGRSQPLYARS